MAKHKVAQGPSGAPEKTPVQRALPEENHIDTLKSRVFRQPVAILFIATSTLITGLAGFTTSLDTILEKFRNWSGLNKHEPLLPKVLRQSEEDCVRPDLACQIDLWLQNPYNKPLYITALNLNVLSVDTEPILGKIESSGTYQVDLTGLSKVGMSRRVPLYQRIDPQKSDRFVLLLGARDLHDRFRRWKLAADLETPEGALELRSLMIELPWDVDYSAGPPVALPTPRRSEQ